MSYQALLFCPDEKTARVVTQVLTELDFTVEACNEPFAAVKKLMGQHFDAVVVDCDNEQNATLLFKSARNSGINQSSLSVAVVEGQAGVAKAFRIGANLVLTKPINVEQSKGTLRVARGLLRKGDVAGKTAADTGSASVAPAASSAISSPSRNTMAAPVFSAPHPSPVAPVPMASSSSFELEDEKTPEPEAAEAALLESMPDPSPVNKSTGSEGSSKDYPWQPMNKLSEPMASALKRAAEVAGASKPSQEEHAAPEVPQVPAPSTSVSWGVSNQGAAAAPAKEPNAAPKTIEFKAPAKAAPSEPREEASKASSQFDAPTFGTLAVKDHEELTAADEHKKSPFIWVAIAAVIIVAGYFGWSKMHAPSQPNSAPAAVAQPTTSPAPSVTPPSATVVATPLPQTSEAAAPATSQAPNTKPAKPSPAQSTASTEGEVIADTESPQRAPMVVKRDQSGAAQTKPAEVEAPQAPAVLGLSGSGDQAAISGIVASTPVTVPKVAPQTVRVSQGVSQGLLTKRVQPVYPQQALQMRLQGEVQMEASIGKDGSITAVKVLKGDSILSRAAVAAVKQWK
jgi:outer membrane biosynthesis protein TonB/ActR/RegA family two-component response regulator